MTIQKEEELANMKKIGAIVALTIAEMQKKAEPGMTTLELDEIGAAILAREGARSAPRLVYDFPGATCISVNEEAAHGIPGARVLQAGDIVNVDVSAEKDGFFADAGRSFVLHPVEEKYEKLCVYTENALNQAIAASRAKKPFHVIGRAVERVAKEGGFRVIRNLGGHGVGRALHESPKFIPAYFEPSDRRRFWKGLVLTIEPFFSFHVDEVTEGDDGWTLKGPAGSRFAQYEHTIVITDKKPIILTSAPVLSS
ncbi:MAG TPA: type I methionyl aminopeptidase [Myxococcales bacterium]|nr:type I methionyl aminopeptidase [Myxococcales bacterium]